MGPSDLFDTYSLRARYLPALLVVAAPAAEVWLLFPKLHERISASLAALGASVGIGLVLLFFVAHVLRARGRTVEKKLNEKNGGFPSTRWLRHRDLNLDPPTKARYHAFLTKHVGNLQLPTESQEMNRPDFADAQYRSAVNWLVNNMRDTTKYPLIFEENVNYGFRRNLLGGKWVGVGLCVLPVAAAALVQFQSGNPARLLDVDAIAAALIATLNSAGWLLLVTEAWVEDASNAYARALLAACES